MACNIGKSAFVRLMCKRGFAAAASPRPIGQVASIESSVQSNGLVVATADSALPITRISVVIRAGSRFENYDNLGAAHLLRIAAGLSTRNSSAFAITRNIQQIGGSLTATSDREIVSYTIETTANEVETALRFLSDLTQPAFKPWELQDSLERVRYQIAAIPPQVRAVELLHKAAFRTGLGNSLYIPKFQIGNLSSETLLHFVNSNFATERTAVVGLGIDQNTLAGWAQTLDLCSGHEKPEPTSYYGGDARKETAGNTANVAIAGQGGALNQKEALAFAILEQAAGGGAATKRGRGNGYIARAVASAAGNVPVAYTSLNASYADAGLFGFVVSGSVDVIGKVIDEATKALKSGAVTTEDFNRGKAAVKVNVLENYSSDSRLIQEIGVQAALTRQVQNADALLAAVDAITLADVQAAAKKAGSSKLSVGAVGNLSRVPYASNLS